MSLNGLATISALGVAMQAQAQDDMADANAEAAQDAYDADMDALDLQRQQSTEQAKDNMSEVAKQQAALAQLRVAAGESGVAGMSVDRAAGEIEMATSQDIATIQANHRNVMKQNTSQGAAVASQAQSRVNSVRGANWGAAALQIGGAAAGGYKDYKKMKATGAV